MIKRKAVDGVEWKRSPAFQYDQPFLDLELIFIIPFFS